MKLLFTGASSFTGHWLVHELAAAGHEVTCVYTRSSLESYDENLRRQRIERVLECSRAVWGCRFGDDRFIDLIDEGGWDVLCHHGADVTDYKSADFNVPAALASNTHRINLVGERLRHGGCHHIVLTGSVFEHGEGAGSQGLQAFSPYGLSKGFTAEIFRYTAAQHGLRLAKFVIPNPFGPFEEPRFTAYLMRHWTDGKTPTVNTPDYVRDNMHVSLLAAVYVGFTEKLLTESGGSKINPSGYIETQGAFAQRFAREMSGRVGVNCPVKLQHQRQFTEPRIRVNTDPIDIDALGWDEAKAWDELANYYKL